METLLNNYWLEADTYLQKKEKDWTENQSIRAGVLFEVYPELKKAYNHCMGLRNIYENRSKEMNVSQKNNIR